jgi:hypothetical protein
MLVFRFNLYLMVHSNVWKFEKIWLSGTLIIIRKPKVWWMDGQEDPLYTPDSRRAGVRDFLGFWMIFKVPLNQMFSNFNTMLCTIKYRLSSIMVHFTFTVPELWSFVKYTVFKFNLYLMVHSNVWKFEKIWLSGTLIIIRKPKVWWMDGQEDPLYTPDSRRAGV